MPILSTHLIQALYIITLDKLFFARVKNTFNGPATLPLPTTRLTILVELKRNALIKSMVIYKKNQ